ncbi:SAM-dependent methyltransferase [Campylobacter lari]|nr:SAM-dependent methyltransferase [Campylobacter lari]
MASRNAIINTIGEKYLSSNVENGEFSYQKAFNIINKKFDELKIKRQKNKTYYTNVDLRFVDIESKITILVETKQDFTKDIDSAKEQLQAYVSYEKKLTNHLIIGILANTTDDRIKVYKNEINSNNLLNNELTLKTFKEYIDLLKPQTTNNREEVMKNTYKLNEILHQYGIKEKLRGQFVGTCLLAIKNNLRYDNLSTKQIIASIKEILEQLLNNNPNKSEKLTILDKKILEQQDIRQLQDNVFREIISFIHKNIYPFINEKSTQGQDLLNLFFTTFNKYVGKDDKNQAFTPDHIVSFMCKAIGINNKSKVLDPCCGSGSFLVRALTDAIDDCKTLEEKEGVKEKNIYGIEREEVAFGLATTNMLIHGDGNSNIYQESCFNMLDKFEEWGIDKVLMNPPYNAQKSVCPNSYTDNWGTSKEDPSKGFYFVYEIAKNVKKGKLAVLLPLQCAIGSSSSIKKYKELMLQEHHLEAVFTLPSDIFHPGASACACCMIFNLGIKHDKALIKETFFGYFKDDGFIKKKYLGRVEKNNGIWKEKEKLWLELFAKKQEVSGLSVLRKVTADDEWLAEAYMETDYSTLTQDDFEKAIRNFLAYKITIRDNNE